MPELIWRPLFFSCKSLFFLFWAHQSLVLLFIFLRGNSSIFTLLSLLFTFSFLQTHHFNSLFFSSSRSICCITFLFVGFWNFSFESSFNCTTNTWDMRVECKLEILVKMRSIHSSHDRLSISNTNFRLNFSVFLWVSPMCLMCVLRDFFEGFKWRRVRSGIIYDSIEFFRISLLLLLLFSFLIYQYHIYTPKYSM